TPLSAVLLLALGLSACAVRAGAPTAPNAPRTPVSLTSAPGGEREFVELVNRHRREKGCQPLAWDAGAARAAQAHSEDMHRRRYFAHTSPGGRTLAQRLDAAGVTGWRSIAENIAQNERGGQTLLNQWLRSPGHRRNLEDCSYTRHGVGRAGELWTHVFVS
ncbi:MAG TPA: CAP domain-containing protein, partial [Longimicrobiaceae bacterium]